MVDLISVNVTPFLPSYFYSYRSSANKLSFQSRPLYESKWGILQRGPKTLSDFGSVKTVEASGANTFGDGIRAYLRDLYKVNDYGIPFQEPVREE